MFGLRKFVYLVIVILFNGCIDEELNKEEKLSDVIQFYYLLPNGYDYQDRVNNKLINLIRESQMWYQIATAGKTFELAKEPLKIVLLKNEIDHYAHNYWGSIHRELRINNEPIGHKGVINFMFLAGSSSLTSDDSSVIGLGVGGCDNSCGSALIGINSLLMPASKGNISTILHEIGHTLGLNHPVNMEDLPLPIKDKPILNSIMCQQDIRNDEDIFELGFLTNEKEIVRKSMFLKEGIQLNYSGVISKQLNYPETDFMPLSAFTYSISTDNHTVYFDNISKNGGHYFWQFGDGVNSNLKSPTHKYAERKNYQAILQVSSEELMTTYYVDVIYLE